MLRNLIHDLIDRLREIRPPRIRASQAPLRAIIGGLAARLGAIELRRPRSWESVQIVPDPLRERLATVRWRLRSSRLGRSADGIIVVPLLGAALILGVFTATAATRGSSDGGSDPSSTSPQVVPGPTITQDEVVTETLVRDGETIRIVRRKPGRVETISGRSVTLPGDAVTVRGGAVTVRGPTHTVVETETRTRTVTDTVTTQQTTTVTDTQTVLVTTTVIEPPPDG